MHERVMLIDKGKTGQYCHQFFTKPERVYKLNSRESPRSTSTDLSYI